MLYHRIARSPRLACSSVAIAICLTAQPVLAQDATTPAASVKDAPPDDDLHNRQTPPANAQIVVTAHGLKTLDLLAGTTPVEGLELQRNLGGQVGEVLMNQPGVSMSGFSPGASRPVLRGFSGERVKLLIDGIGSIDASNVSDDHAVAIDPFNAERIDVLRGPAVLLYGSQAIGGAVNIVDKRIPSRLPDEPIHFDGLVGANTVADMREAAASIDAPLGGHFALHVDGAYHRTGDVSVPGFTVAAPLRSQLLGQADMAQASDPAYATLLRTQANQRDVLPNSFTDTYSGNVGFAFIRDDSNIGASMGYYDTYYGVPKRPGIDGDPIAIGLQQWRGDLRAELELGEGLFERLATRVAYSHYTHTEFDGPDPATTFNVEGMEGRAELIENERSDWSGSVGIQYSTRNMKLAGDELLLPRNITGNFAVFGLQQIPLGGLRLQLAGRYEHANVRAPDLGFARSFDTWSGALGLTREFAGGLEIGFNANRVARAPSAEELLVDGAHDATQTYERGDPNLGTENAVGGELFVRGRLGESTVSLTGFYNHFTGYIYQLGTGAVEEDLPVYEYRQGNADYYGLEGEVDVPFVQTDGLDLKGELRGSYVRARLDNGTNVPRIPPLSLFGALEGVVGQFTARGEISWNARQDKVAPNETPTDSYTFVNASLAWKPISGNDNITVLLKADNIFDITGRLATSLTKDYTPLPGRNFEVSVRVSL
jgi:iron complex outermembrane receptor protein